MNSSKILNTSWIVSFEPEEIVKWVDPFDTISLKLLTIIIYIIEILASTILLTFVVFETSGLAGHYRTVINQILSCGYGAVRASIFLFKFLNANILLCFWGSAKSKVYVESIYHLHLWLNLQFIVINFTGSYVWHSSRWNQNCSNIVWTTII